MTILAVKPYLQSSDDLLHLVVQVELFVLVLAGFIYYEYPFGLDPVVEGWLSACLILMTVIFFLLFLSQAILLSVKMALKWWRDRKEKNNRKQQPEGFVGDGGDGKADGPKGVGASHVSAGSIIERLERGVVFVKKRVPKRSERRKSVDQNKEDDQSASQPDRPLPPWVKASNNRRMSATDNADRKNIRHARKRSIGGTAIAVGGESRGRSKSRTHSGQPDPQDLANLITDVDDRGRSMSKSPSRSNPRVQPAIHHPDTTPQ
jgi:hypothetical protein